MQTLILAALVACGVVIGMVLVGQQNARVQSERSRNSWPDVNIEHAAGNALAKLGFRTTGREPASWRDISIRLFQDQNGTINAVTCHIAPADVASVIDFPPGSRRPCEDRPPADWPWGSAHDPWAVPAWWHVYPGQSRYFEQTLVHGGARGIFASYDPQSGSLCFWQWQRATWSLARDQPLKYVVADVLATALERSVRESGHPCDAAGWLEVTNLHAQRLGLPAERLPGAITTIDAQMYPLRDGHRYLLAVHGLGETAAWALVGEQPLRELRRSSPPPLPVWSFALHPPAAARSQDAAELPSWFSPGAGPRRAHCLLTLGSGAVEAGRWVAYDVERQTVFIWDWAGPQAQSATADLCHE